MKTYSIAAFAAALLVSGAAQAAILDFETGYSADKTAIVGDEFEAAFGVTFSSTFGVNIVKVGGPTNGFVPNDTPVPADAFGDFFLTSNFSKITDLSISYTTAVAEASFDVADIDGSGSQLEEFTFTALDADDNVLATRTVNGNDADAGDAVVTRIGFSGLSGLISKIDITGTTAGGTRDIGIAFDNFNTDFDTTTPVPLPAGLPLAAAAFGALGLLRARRKA
ncbi:hypothetical protein ACVDG3_10030 [Meridianimarinicoccus sp. RP-17]|uniref:hypothetical protein n=1 Tax=Meridianimarinicoccus zhengii TaxID=2056810 RepID=UPI000DAB3C39|nr:hypothetical protein [Phycocomes zhengii]